MPGPGYVQQLQSALGTPTVTTSPSDYFASLAPAPAAAPAAPPSTPSGPAAGYDLELEDTGANPSSAVSPFGGEPEGLGFHAPGARGASEIEKHNTKLAAELSVEADRKKRLIAEERERLTPAYGHSVLEALRDPLAPTSGETPPDALDAMARKNVEQRLANEPGAKEKTAAEADALATFPTTGTHADVSGQRPPAGGGGGGVVPAHEQPIVDPKRQEALFATFPRERDAEYEAMQREAEGHEAAAAAMSQAVSDAQREQLEAHEDRINRQQLVGQMLQDAHNAARDVASKKVDPERFWKSRSTGQQIAYTIALALGGFAHDHTAANTIQHLIDLDVEAQRSDIENGHKTVQDKMSMFHAALQSTSSMDLAQQQDIATKLNYAMLKVKEQAEESQAPIIRARAQALLAQMDRKMIEVGIAFNKYVPAQMATGGVAGSLERGAPVEVTGQMQVVVLPDGKEVLIPHGGEVVATSVATSLRAAEEGKELDQLMAQQPSSLNYGAFKQWTSQVNAKMKAISQLDATHLGSGARGSLGMFKNIASAIDSGNLKDQGYLGDVWDYGISGWRPEAIRKNAQTLARQSVLDADRILATHNGIIGEQDTQTYPAAKRGGPATSKIVFYPHTAYRHGTISGMAGVTGRDSAATNVVPTVPVGTFEKRTPGK